MLNLIVAKTLCSATTNRLALGFSRSPVPKNYPSLCPVATLSSARDPSQCDLPSMCHSRQEEPVPLIFDSHSIEQSGAARMTRNSILALESSTLE